MTDTSFWPFALEDTFFINFCLSRQPGILDNTEMQLSAQAKVMLRNNEQKLQVNVRLRTTNEDPVKIEVEAVGLFNYLNGEPDINHQLLIKYINLFALPIIWSFIKTNIKMISSSMGMSPINLAIPEVFEMPETSIFPHGGTEKKEG